MLDQGWKPSDPGDARGISESDIRAADERKVNPVDRDRVITLHIQKVITAKREKVYRRERCGAAEISEPLSRNLARSPRQNSVSYEREGLGAKSWELDSAIDRALHKRVFEQ